MIEKHDMGLSTAAIDADIYLRSAERYWRFKQRMKVFFAGLFLACLFLGPLAYMVWDKPRVDERHLKELGEAYVNGLNAAKADFAASQKLFCGGQ
jgi:hypothetical protein